MILWRGNAIGTPSWFRDFCDTVLQLWFFFSGALYRPSVLETTEARELSSMDSCPQGCFEYGFPSVLLLQSERILCIVCPLTLQLETSYCSENMTCNSCQYTFWEIICKCVPFHNSFHAQEFPSECWEPDSRRTMKLKSGENTINLLFTIEGKLSAAT